MIVIFACRRSRLRDIGLLRLGAASAGHTLRVIVWPWAFVVLPVAAVARLLGMRQFLVVSDKFPADTLPARLYGRHCTRMLWNYADEWPAAGVRLPRHKVCFFQEAGHTVDLFVFAPQPRRSAPRLETRRPIVFVGDVTAELPLPRGSAWWRDRFGELCATYGYTFYLRPEYDALIERELPATGQRRTARVLAKNLLRLWIVERARQHFGARLVLVGSNWRRFGLGCEPSLYSQPKRLQLYESAIVNLDCGSKSGENSLYPRSSELISYAGGLLQVRCADTDAVFGERAGEFSFDGGDDLIARIEHRLAETPGARSDRDGWLAQRLRERELLMQHSIERMIRHASDGAGRAC